MTVTELPTITRPAGLDRLRRLTGASSDDEAVNEAIRQLEAVNADATSTEESAAERNRRLLAEMDRWDYDGPSASGADVVAAVEHGRTERTESILQAISGK